MPASLEAATANGEGDEEEDDPEADEGDSTPAGDEKRLEAVGCFGRVGDRGTEDSRYEEEHRELADVAVITEEAVVEGGDDQRAEYDRADQEPQQKASLRPVASR